MDKKKIISNLLDEGFLALKDLKEERLKDASDRLFALVRKIDSLKVVFDIEKT